MSGKMLVCLLAIFVLTQVGAVQAPKLAAGIPADAVAAGFIKDLPALAQGKAWLSSLSQVFVDEIAIVLLEIPREKRIPPFLILGKVNPEKLQWFLDTRLKPILQRNLGEVRFAVSQGVNEILVNDSSIAFYAVKDGVLSFSLERKVVAGFISKPLPTVKSLQASPLFAKALARISTGSRTVLFVNVKRIFEAFDEKIPERAKQVLKTAGILDIEALAACDEVADGARLGSLSLITSGKPGGFLALAAPSAGALTTPQLIPGDYSFFARFRFSSFSDAWGQLVETAKEIAEQEERLIEEEAEEEKEKSEEEGAEAVTEEESEEGPQDPFTEFLYGFREATGVDFEKDVLGSLGGEVAVAVAVPEKLRIPDGVALLELKDRKKVEEVLLKLIPAPGETAEYKEAPIRTVNLGRVSPAYAFIDKYLVVGTNVSAVKSVLDAKAGEGALAGNPAFRTAAGRLGEAGHFFYLDVGSGLPLILSAIGQSAARFGDEPGSEPKWVARAKLLISPILTDLIVAYNVFGDGESLTVRGYCTFTGTYQWMAGSSIMMGMMMPALMRARESARRAACLNNLKQLVTGEKVYAMDHDGKFTEKLSDLYPEYVTGLGVFTCPSRGRSEITSKEDIDSQTSYVLRSGLTEKSSADEVLIYEKPGNHRGGGNVAYLDGHVRWLSGSGFEEVIESVAEEGPEEGAPEEATEVLR